jgi:hypothetical protein
MCCSSVATFGGPTASEPARTVEPSGLRDVAVREEADSFFPSSRRERLLESRQVAD